MSRAPCRDFLGLCGSRVPYGFLKYPKQKYFYHRGTENAEEKKMGLRAA